MRFVSVVLLPVLTLASLGAVLASCNAGPEALSHEEQAAGDDPAETATDESTETRAEEDPMVEETDDAELLRRRAQVEELELVVLKSFPVQVRATVQGTLPDACTELDEILQERDGKQLRVTITTRRPADALCAQVIGHFQETIDLEVHGLAAGTYQVVVNDRLRREITFDRDNVLQVP